MVITHILLGRYLIDEPLLIILLLSHIHKDEMRNLINIILLLLLMSCDDAAKLYRLGKRIERATNNHESLTNNEKGIKQNDWGVSTVIGIDTFINKEADYSVDLLLPVDTSNSILMTMSILPYLITGYSENESNIVLNFFQDTSLVNKYLVNYAQTSNNQYKYKVIRKYDSPTICISNGR